MYLQSKDQLRVALADMSQPFSKEDLEEIIHNEFFSESNPLDCELLEAVIRRKLSMEGVSFDAVTLEKERERMIYRILGEIFINKK